jgi:hypothetical protein
MPYPRYDMNVFKVLECLYRHGEQTPEEVIEKIGYVTDRNNRSAMMNIFKQAVLQEYVIKEENCYRLTPDLESYVEDVLEMKGVIPKKDVVKPAYKNFFTPEMKLYETKLFANKRGYENGFK